MTVPANTFQVYTQVNIREDLINAIYNVDPYKTPFLNMTKKAEANQTFTSGISTHSRRRTWRTHRSKAMCPRTL